MQAVVAILVIAALGDSVTAGARPATRRASSRARFPSYVQIIGTKLRERAVNAGVPGDTSAAMLARLDKVLAAAAPVRPRIVLVMAGLNDAARVDAGGAPRQEPRVAEEDFEKNLTAIVERVRKAKAEPVLITPNPMTRAYRYQNAPFYQENDINDGLAPYVDITRRVARLTGACLVDVYGDWLGRARHRAWIPDGLHPNAEGHRLIAAKAMEACGAVMTRGKAAR